MLIVVKIPPEDWKSIILNLETVEILREIKYYTAFPNSISPLSENNENWLFVRPEIVDQTQDIMG